VKIKTQGEVLAKLELETRKAMRDHEDRSVLTLIRAWRAVQVQMRSIILSEYMSDFPQKDWTLFEAKRKGTLIRIDHRITQALNIFFTFTHNHLLKVLLESHQQETLRALWMLAVTTPKSTVIKAPNGNAIREADVPEDATPWALRLSTWLGLLRNQININLTSQALAGNTLQEAAAEATDAKVKLPQGNFDFDGLLERMSRYEMISAQASARGDVSDANDDIITREVFMTLADDKVCPECEALEGAELSGPNDENYPPIHLGPCRCFVSQVPMEWAELLRSGTPEDQQFVKDLEELGMAPTAMAVRDSEGKIEGSVIVSFEDWSSKYGPVVGSAANAR